MLCSDEENAVEIVDALVTHLALSEEAIREEIVLKIAIVSERCCNTDWAWYLDTMLNVLAVAGDFVPEDVWHRIIHVVTNNKVIAVQCSASYANLLYQLSINGQQ